MEPRIDESFHEQVASLDNHFSTASAALAKGDFSGLKKSLTTIVKIANVLLTVIGALEGARAKK